MSISRFHFITQDLQNSSHQQQTLNACVGEANWIQLRIKNQSIQDVKKIAIDCLAICRKYNVKLILNDYVEVVAELKLDGVHIGKEDMKPLDARKILGTQFIIGGTANSLEDVAFLNECKVNYIGLGPYRFTKTKNNLSPIVGEEGYKSILLSCNKNKLQVPIVAIGGIEFDDVSKIMNTGVHGIAVAGAVNNHPDPSSSLKNFMKKVYSDQN